MVEKVEGFGYVGWIFTFTAGGLSAEETDTVGGGFEVGGSSLMEDECCKNDEEEERGGEEEEECKLEEVAAEGLNE